ncbi:hypothetical protein [Xanthomonas sp. 4461]|uniref:hypothetical protein n=1 Tax=Xanthomonas sp. 4461 TaxID=3035313 RepID=UPI002168A8BC|nr:hypothetical protein [Xanthomonas sp. 4461]MCS3811250.1 hypothetical protein [Xanthomonas sp. 4461]
MMGRERSAGTPRSGKAGLGVADTLAGELATLIGWMTGLPSGLHSFDRATVAKPCNAGNRAWRSDERGFSIVTVSAALTERDPLAGDGATARCHQADGSGVHAQEMTRWFATDAPRLCLDAVETAVPGHRWTAEKAGVAYS